MFKEGNKLETAMMGNIEVFSIKAMKSNIINIGILRTWILKCIGIVDIAY
jgi:hypothetical protein